MILFCGATCARYIRFVYFLARTNLTRNIIFMTSQSSLCLMFFIICFVDIVFYKRHCLKFDVQYSTQYQYKGSNYKVDESA